MFIRDLDDVDNKNAKENAILGLPFKSIFSDQVQIGERSINGNQLKWSVFHAVSYTHLMFVGTIEEAAEKARQLGQ